MPPSLASPCLLLREGARVEALTLPLSERWGWPVPMEDRDLRVMLWGRAGFSWVQAPAPARPLLEAGPLALEQLLRKQSWELGLAQGYPRQAGPWAGPGPGSRW